MDSDDALPDNHSAYLVPGLLRGLRVLEILAENGAPMTLSEIARELEVSRSSAFRLVYTLRQMNCLKDGEQKNTFTLGARVLNLGFAYLNQQSITTIARPYLSALRDEVGISTHLSVLEGHDVLYLSSHQARTGYVSNLTTGTRRRAHASTIGWVLLGDLSAEEMEAFCKGVDWTPETEHTPRNCAELAARVGQARADGYVFSHGLGRTGGSSLAVPVRNNLGRIVACVNISGPDGAFDFDRVDSFYRPAVQRTALRISEELGFSA
ncbi:IclR family transcriptional regulator [Acuticoccus sediminis]|uniref:IclR family transcriptional regulator n=1 Tax=Acuticoccus sediminis TaxID=2184697 RepID=UPI001CFDAA07|nr:IclR family transcriptional regulator [Acuticoccus sediminis]